MKALFHAPLCVVGIAALCFTSVGCRSTSGFGLRKACEGGACELPTDHQVSNQTPAEMFAAMNADSYADAIRSEAKTAERIAELPKGPDSLFAPYR
ncbi:MAG: hypothetical protein AAFU85_17440 [Planctomycetota bacterium]